MKKILGVAGLIVLSVVLFFIFRPKPVAYLTVEVTRGNITNFVEATGTLNPVGNTTVDVTGTVTGGVTVGAQVNGRIMSVNVGYNSRVKKGEVMAVIDPTTYETDVQSAQADLWNAQAAISTARANAAKSQAGIANAQAQLAKDKANERNAKLIYDRDLVLIKKNYIAQSDADAARAGYYAAAAQTESDAALIRSAREDAASTQDQVEAAVAAAKNKQAALSKAEINLSYTKILAPVDGIVVGSNAAVGQMVVSSFQSPSLFVIAKSLKTMQIDTLVDEADVPKIRPGQTVHFNIDSYPNDTFTGTVAQIRKNPITQSNVVNYDVISYTPNPGEKFLPGMTANVNFIVSQKRGVLLIPNRALLFSPAAAGGRAQGRGSVPGAPGGAPGAPQAAPGPGAPNASRKKGGVKVWVLERGRPVAKEAAVGITDGTNTEVISGLTEGEKIITGTQSQKTRSNPFSTF